MYGVEWLIGLALLGIATGIGAGYLLANRTGGNRSRELESQLAASRQELTEYRQEVVRQFSETARKFQNLNDSYTDLHEQLARSSSVLCGDLTGTLLEAPAGHQTLIPAEVREGETRTGTTRAGATAEHGRTTTGTDTSHGQRTATMDPYDDAGEIRVAEPAADAAGQAARNREAPASAATGRSGAGPQDEPDVTPAEAGQAYDGAPEGGTDRSSTANQRPSSSSTPSAAEATKPAAAPAGRAAATDASTGSAIGASASASTPSSTGSSTDSSTESSTRSATASEEAAAASDTAAEQSKRAAVSQ